MGGARRTKPRPAKFEIAPRFWEMEKPGGYSSTGPKFVGRSLLGLFRLVGLRVGRNGGRCLVAAEAHQVRHEGRDFEGHLLALRHCSYRLALDHLQLVVPRVELDAPADRE